MTFRLAEGEAFTGEKDVPDFCGALRLLGRALSADPSSSLGDGNRTGPAVAGTLEAGRLTNSHPDPPSATLVRRSSQLSRML